MSSNSNIVLDMDKWNVAASRYMPPRLNDRGGKSVNIICTQTNRAIHVILPMLMSWGISDYVDDKTGESDNKFTCSLQFPRDMDRTDETDLALQKLKDFEEQLLCDAVKHSEVWFGKKQSREIVEHSYFSFLKYSKDKTTGDVDTTKAPSIRPKVPCYNGVWNVQIYDTKGAMLFPPVTSSEGTPMEFVPKMSLVKAVVQCGGIWVGGKGWGLTWKLNQCVVKEQVMETVFQGGLSFNLTSKETDIINKSTSKEDIVVDNTNTYVADSDEEEEPMKGVVSDDVGDKVEESMNNEGEGEPIGVVSDVVGNNEGKGEPMDVVSDVVDDKEVQEPKTSVKVETNTAPVKKKIIKKAKVVV
jgi:hypothetical protein